MLLVPSLYALWITLQTPVPPQDATPPVESPAPVPPWEEKATVDTGPKPGELPADVSEEALARWYQLCRSTRVEGAERAPATSFDLRFNVWARGDDGRRNEFTMRQRFLEPHFVRSLIEDTGLEDGRGPDGYWLFDPKAAEGQRRVRLAGRENAKSRENVDQLIALSRDFLALTDPGSLRVLSLRATNGPPLQLLPQAVHSLARGLAWLEVQSPDFLVPGAAAQAADHTARIGIDKETGRARIAVVTNEKPAQRPETRAGVVLVLEKERESAGYVLPRSIHAYDLALDLGPGGVLAGLRVGQEPSQELWVMAADLAPELTPDDFRLPE